MNENVFSPTPASTTREPRLPVLRDATLVDAEGVETPVKLLDLSPSGCRVRHEGALRVADKVRLRAGREDERSAEVRWIADEEAGLRFLAD